jgi:hydroxymethylbilane synthase
VATRDGQAALVRARAVVSALERANPRLEFHVVIARVSATGAVAGEGRAVAALAAALLADAADIAVIGLGGVSLGVPGKTTLAAVPRRADPRDVYISRGGRGIGALAPGSRVGASTPLRRSQLLRMRPDLTPVPVLGPADAHLRRLVRGDDGLAAIIVEAARLARKGLLGHAAEALPPERFPPARGQGAVGVLARAGDRSACDTVRGIDDDATRAAWEAERSFVESLGSPFDSPVGAFARTYEDGRLHLTGAVYSRDGAEEVRGEASGPTGRARDIGVSLAGRLLARGAREIMAPAAVPA